MANLSWALGPGRDMDRGLCDWVNNFDSDREKWLHEACRIERQAGAMCQQLGLKGSLQLFGSAVSGFGSSTSDVDLVFVTTEGADAVEPLEALRRLQACLRDTEACCYNLTTIFQPRAPLLKLTDLTGIEVDLVVNNYLGVRNTQLLRAYHDWGEEDGPTGRARIDIMVRAAKEWARRCGLVGTIDGLLNSYAWTLMAIYYLQVVEVLPNFQLLAESSGEPPCRVEGYETRFTVPPVQATDPASPAAAATAGVLLWGFFQFYAYEFNWKDCAVCIRLGRPAPNYVRKDTLHYGTRAFWYIEDPFNTRMNLARGTTASGRERIHGALRAAASQLRERPEWSLVCPNDLDRPFKQLFLKMRLQDVSSRDALPSAIWSLLGPGTPQRLFIRSEPEAVDIYAQFNTWQDLRSTQSCNEQRIPLCDQPVALYISLGYGLWEDLDHFFVDEPPRERRSASELRPELERLFRPLPFMQRLASPPPLLGPPPPARKGPEGAPVPPAFTPPVFVAPQEPPMPPPNRSPMNPAAAMFVPATVGYSAAPSSAGGATFPAAATGPAAQGGPRKLGNELFAGYGLPHCAPASAPAAPAACPSSGSYLPPMGGHMRSGGLGDTGWGYVPEAPSSVSRGSAAPANAVARAPYGVNGLAAPPLDGGVGGINAARHAVSAFGPPPMPPPPQPHFAAGPAASATGPRAPGGYWPAAALPQEDCFIGELVEL